MLMQSGFHRSLGVAGSWGKKTGSERQLLNRLDQDMGLAGHVPNEHPHVSLLLLYQEASWRNVIG